MYIVYILQDTSGEMYKGMTNNLERRLTEHISGQARSTRHLKEIRVVYTESFPDRTSARIREKYFKSAAGRKFLKTKISRGRSSAG